MDCFAFYNLASMQQAPRLGKAKPLAVSTILTTELAIDLKKTQEQKQRREKKCKEELSVLP